MYLFLDSTKNITVGLLSDTCEWVDYQYLVSKKSSSEIHPLIYSLFEKHQLSFDDMTGVFFCAGPGSYTGMRVTAGITDIMQWYGLSIHTFYHFEVPSWCGHDEGVWLGKAFKGEVFIFKWNNHTGESNKSLVAEDLLENSLKNDKKNIFCGHEEFMEINPIKTKDLIYKYPREVFRAVLQKNKKQDLYYYRSLDNEFVRKK
ncbi:MAG: hypothetical protein QF441_12575 [Bacteriovoracaceae bacterium]|jgi:tRNA threonylcarbamoyladenosine biosynthesis protein TsaB|nr:hypothetical protein [Halobacteriovoraceae bacterium]MDP7321439.1 hypothetical protein [Bacteriovoracaceae bacterium]|tara:strand:- start:109 stop:714 length:606 start_codon:yes stop_codon:yes gene_type:complete